MPQKARFPRRRQCIVHSVGSGRSLRSSMSTNVIRLIPQVPTYTPRAEAIARAKQVLRAVLSRTTVVEAIVSSNVRFVDQGENFECVRCPSCAVELSGSWWQDAMDRAHPGAFEDLAVTLPCCSESSTLHDLDYRWPAGFAKFTLQGVDPGIHSPLPEAVVQQLQDILGCRLREIRARY